MKVAALVVSLMLLSPLLFADDRDVDFDKQVNFSTLKTFTIREGQVTSRKPELDNKLVLKKIEDAVRAQLTAKGLTETQNRPDLVVTYHLGAADKREVERWPAGRRGWGTRQRTLKFTEGTLVVDMTERDSRELVWRGIYHDDESNAAKISNKLPDDIKKLLSDYPPKK